MSLLKERQREVGEKEGLVELIKGVIKGGKDLDFCYTKNCCEYRVLLHYIVLEEEIREKESGLRGEERDYRDRMCET